jgi:hypothetical protein
VVTAYLLLLVDLGGGGLDLTGTSQTSLCTLLVGCWNMLSMLDVVEDVERLVLYVNLAAGKTKRVSMFQNRKWREISFLSIGIRSFIHPFIYPSNIRIPSNTRLSRPYKFRIS